MCEKLITETNIYARVLIEKMFRSAADDDYIVARWSVRAGLNFQFYWSAQQSLEKYMKAILLMNGVSVKNHKHNLKGLLDKVKTVSCKLLDDTLSPPEGFPEDFPFLELYEESIDRFIERCNENGDASNRYRYYGAEHSTFDLHKFDNVCFLLRRLIFPLSMKNYLSFSTDFRGFLSQNPHYQHDDLEASLRNAKSKEFHEEIINVVKWRNFAYFQIDSKNSTDGRLNIYGRQSVIGDLLERGNPGKEAVIWLQKNAFFSRQDRAELEKLLKQGV